MSSSGNLFAVLDTGHIAASAAAQKKKGRAGNAACGTFQTVEVSAFYCFGVSVDFGAVDLGAVVAGAFGPAGFGAVPEAAGAATPDCTL